MNQSKSQDILAKLLSNENITVTRGSVSTASFDIKNRVLTLPTWKEMTQAIEEMLMLHEVGHALYTSPDTYGVVFNEKKHLKDYANVIEDVRIEKAMKDRYPGSRKSFNVGYRELIEKDFFGVGKRDLNELKLIDRINLYFKVGYGSGIQFSSLEQYYIQKVDKCKTEEDVIALAEEIYKFAEQQEVNKVASAPTQSPDIDDMTFEEDVGDEEPSDVQDQEVDDTKDGPPKKSMSDLSQEQQDKIKDNLKSDTASSLEKNLEQNTDRVTEHVYYELEFEYAAKDVIIPYKNILKELMTVVPQDHLQLHREKYNKFKTNSAPMINYMIKEFEMRKSATAYKRTKISRIGQLDPRKLYAYKIKEDLFKQIATVQDGKKHGMIFLLDWSGSMNSYIDETIEQVINLAMFCQRSQIAYQVFAFTDGYNQDKRYEEAYRRSTLQRRPDNAKGIDDEHSFNLLELFSNRMTGVEFNKQVEFMLSKPYRRRNYKLNGTPLNQALLYMTKYAGEFKKLNQVEKLSLITLTDGESNTLNTSKGIYNGRAYINGEYKDVKSFVRDNVMKKDYAIDLDQSNQTSTLLKIICDRHDATSIGFFIMDAKGHGSGSFIKHNIRNLKPGQVYSLKEKIQSGLRKDRYVILNEVPGRHEYYIIPSDQRIEEVDLAKVTADMNAASIAREMTKAMTSSKQSRIILNSFIGQVA